MGRSERELVLHCGKSAPITRTRHRAGHNARKVLDCIQLRGPSNSVLLAELLVSVKRVHLCEQCVYGPLSCFLTILEGVWLIRGL